MSLNESRLFTFIDNEKGFTLNFLEGQKLVHDLAIIHDLKGESFAFFRDAVLSGMTMVAYTKPGEGLGFYIDSDNPYFRLKLETNYTGKMRTLLIVNEEGRISKDVTGVARISKISPAMQTPYTSIVELKGTPMNEIINNILKSSYQVNAETFLSNEADQVVLVGRLPQVNVNKEVIENPLTIKEYWMSIQEKINAIHAKALSDEQEIIKEFQDLGYEYLGSKGIQFECPCSQERMIMGLRSLANNDIDSVFEGKDEVEVKCDYCNTYYLITKDMMK